MTRNQNFDIEQEIGTGEAAELLGVSARWIQKLAADGWVEPLAKGRWSLGGLVRGYIAFLKDENSRKTKSAGESRLKDARAQEVELRIAREDRKVIDLAEAIGFFDRTTGLFLETLSGLPAQIAKERRERDRIEAIIDDRRDRLFNRFGEIRANLRSGHEADPADAEDDA